MANFIQKFADAREYENAEHQYPNISLVEGEGLIWTAENPDKETILFNGSEIKWTLDDVSWDYTDGALDIDLNSVVAFNAAVGDGTVSTSNAWFELDGTRYDADVTLKGDGDSLRFSVILEAITNTKSAAPQVYYNFTIIDGRDTVEGLTVEENSGQIAHWGLNYTISDF